MLTSFCLRFFLCTDVFGEINNNNNTGYRDETSLACFKKTSAILQGIRDNL